MEPPDAEGNYNVELGHGLGVQVGDHGRQTNIFHLLANSAPGLSSFIRAKEFQTLVDERTRLFVGRDLTFRAISDALVDASFPSGYVLVRGEPGIGKTALIAELVKRWNCVHHFNVASQNIRSANDFLTNVCAQLIVRYELPYSELPPQRVSDSGFLTRLLREAAAKTPHPVIILVDALDEADCGGLPAGANCLFLPPSLPPGVFLIVTSREEYDQRLHVDREKAIYLRENDAENQRDVKAYITSVISASEDAMIRRIDEWNVSASDFIETLAVKSEGNFMYLVYVLSDIRDGIITKESVDSIRNLPRGLQSYYRGHWRLMKAQQPKRFEKLYEPVLCQLAVVREPVTVSQLVEWTRLPAPRISEVVTAWRQFLNEDSSPDGEATFRLYHASFQDFLRQEVGLARFHERIAETALNKIPGFRAL